MGYNRWKFCVKTISENTHTHMHKSTKKRKKEKEKKKDPFNLSKGSPEREFDKVMALFCRVKTLFQTFP